MKYLLLGFLALFCANANAQYPENTNFEFYYHGNLVETDGNFFSSALLILPRGNIYQTASVGVVNSFRNIFTAYENKNTNWLNKNIEGNAKQKQQNLKKFLDKFRQDELFYMRGYALFNNYAIVLLEHKIRNEKLIFVMKKTKNNGYVPSASFKHIFPRQYKIINQAFKGNGELKIVKLK